MRFRLALLGLVAAAGLATAPAASSAALQYDRPCGNKIVDTQCYDTDCGFVDCTVSDCVLYLNPLGDPLLDICIGQTRPQG